ncbi:MAG: hypothetical protein L0332_12590 [Chloroflexi bacterium]|nr:hypothetical protein [Chloroflexota bacterium]MCI0727545.1 hypothetical protein [Chloroflexota bacterium]
MDGADLVIIRATDPAGRPATGERKVNGIHLLKMKRPFRVRATKPPPAAGK